VVVVVVPGDASSVRLTSAQGNEQPFALHPQADGSALAVLTTNRDVNSLDEVLVEGHDPIALGRAIEISETLPRP
jgi:hypothetical protein